MSGPIAAATVTEVADGKSTQTLATVFKSQSMAQLRAPVHYVTVTMTSAGVTYAPACGIKAKHWRQTSAREVPAERMCSHCLKVGPA